MMKKNRQMTNQMKGMFLLTLPLLLVSCGSFQATSYYGDGIYGEEVSMERTQRVVYEDTGSKMSTTNPSYYRSYFNEVASQANGNYTYFTDIDSYSTTAKAPENNNNSYAGWGHNRVPGNVTVNIYDNYNPWGYDPYFYDSWNFGNTYYWGMGAWSSPYYRSSWGYYRPRNYVSFGFGWGSGWNYPYYGYGYRPYYYGYHTYYGYNPYYYYGGGYYPYYSRPIYYNPKNYAYVKGIRGGHGNYDSETRGSYSNQRGYIRRDGQSNNSSTRVYNGRSYTRGSGTYTPSQSSRTYSRSSNNSSNNTVPSTGRVYRSSTPSSSRTYESSSNSSSSGRTYTPRSSSSSRSYGRSSSSSSSGRTYSSGRRGR